MFRFEIDQFSSSLQSGSRLRTVVISVQAKVVDLLSLHVSHLHGAERIANTADDNVPKSFGRSFIDTFCIDNVSWHLDSFLFYFSDIIPGGVWTC